MKNLNKHVTRLCPYCPHMFNSKETAESEFGAKKRRYELPKRLPGLRSHWNHNGRWLGSNCRLDIACAEVHEAQATNGRIV